ncbi:hypothetical protein [Corallococcus silvisoli]|nr:hypothetical protein [Corallococcus silvisoli]
MVLRGVEAHGAYRCPDARAATPALGMTAAGALVHLMSRVTRYP